MANVEDVTVTLPNDVIHDMDRQTDDRTEFIAEAVRREIERRRTMEFLRSLENPHPDSMLAAELGFAEWSNGLPNEDTEALASPTGGTEVSWMPDEGWVEGKS